MDNLFAQADETKRSPNNAGCPSSDPVYHETIGITVPFGPTGFQKVILSMESGPFYVFSDFRCAMFYIPCLSHVFIKPW